MKGAEEVVKTTEKKNKSEDKSPENKDNKRCDSVTGSNLDSSSSSNSSIDSDDLEQMVDNYAKAKVNMTQNETMHPPPNDIMNKQMNHKSDKSINGYTEKAKLKSHTETAKPINGTTVTVTDSADQTINGKAQRNATKKQARRERRQKEKEKRNGENQYQQAQEKASRQRTEQASMVQNLMSLRISDNPTIVQKRSQQTVPVSFGDFPDQNRALGLSQQNAFAFQAPNIDNELVQVYTAGHNMQELFRREEPQIQAKVDKNSNLNGKRTGSQDGLEMDNVMKMVDDSNKLAQKYSPWMRSFHNSLVDGDPVVFENKFKCILRILKKSDDRARYERMTDRQFTEHVMIGVIRQFYNELQSTTVLHQLAATRNVGTPCSSRGHGSCKMIRTVLGMLSWGDMRSTMRIRTFKTGKTAMHLAAATGEWCQLDALMSYDMWPNVLDYSGRAPIHYAVTKNDLPLVKLLLWYGADLSLMERQCTPLQLASLNPRTLEVANYLDTRRDALESLFIRWAESFVRGVWTPIRAISDLHFMRLSKEGDTRPDVHRSLETGLRRTTLNMRVNVSHNSELKKCPLSLLFIIPTFYKNEDRFFDASDPQIFRASLTVDGKKDVCRLIQSIPTLKGKKFEQARALEPAFTNPHNGHFYVFELPRSLQQGVYNLNFGVNTEPLKEKALHINLAMQAFACGPPELRQWEAMRLRLEKTKKME